LNLTPRPSSRRDDACDARRKRDCKMTISRKRADVLWPSRRAEGRVARIAAVSFRSGRHDEPRDFR
jgi:hypothetical protein